MVARITYLFRPIPGRGAARSDADLIRDLRRQSARQQCRYDLGRWMADGPVPGPA